MRMERATRVRDASASRLTDRIRLGGVIASLLATLAPPLVALLLQRTAASPRDVATVMVPIAIVAIGWLQHRWSVRVALSAVGVYSYLVGAVLLDTPASITWPPVASSTFAASVVVIAGTTGLWGLIGIAASATLCAVGVMVQPVSTFNISVDFLGGWITPLVCVGLGLSFFIVLRVWDVRAQVFDQETEQIRLAHRAALEEAEGDAARRLVDRRIHETVLNTLNAITVSNDRAQIQEHCRLDLRTLTDTTAPPNHLLSTIIADASARFPHLRVQVDVEGEASIEDQYLRSIVSDAITELLRNVQRHSGVNEAAVTARATGESVTITVDDAGQGMPEGAAARFGLRHTLMSSISDIGGRVRWLPAEPQGTRVEVTIPIAARSNPLTMPTSSDFLLDSLTARIALVPTLWIGLLAVPVAALSFAQPWAILIAYATLMVFAVGLIFGWASNHRQSRAILTLLAALATCAVAAATQTGCTSAVAFHWVIFASAGSIALIVLAQNSLITRAATAAAALVATTLLAFSSPAECRLDAVDAALENAMWVIIIVAVVTTLTTNVDRYRESADHEWLEATRLRARALASQGAAARWVAARETVDGLLRSIAEGDIDPLDPRSQARARLIQTRLRSLLEVGQLRDPSTRQVWEGFLALHTSEHSSVLIEVLDEQHARPMDRVFADLSELMREASGEQMSISLLTDSILVHMPQVPTLNFASPRWALLEHSAGQGCTLECADARPRASRQ